MGAMCDVIAATEIPVLSQIADAASAGFSVYQGDYVGAGLSAAGILVPSLSQMKAGRTVARMAARGGNVANRGYRAASKAARSALADRVGKRGFSEVGYQFQKHMGRGARNWGDIIQTGTKLNPGTFNQAGYNTFREIWRAPGSFQNVGGFLEKRLPDGRGMRLQQDGMFKGFLD